MVMADRHRPPGLLDLLGQSVQEGWKVLVGLAVLVHPEGLSMVHIVEDVVLEGLPVGLAGSDKLQGGVRHLDLYPSRCPFKESSRQEFQARTTSELGSRPP
jgi:hypothetical protein